MNVWQTVLVTLGGTGVLLTAVAWLVKKIVTHFLDKDVEVYKVKIQSETDKEIERLKSELRIQEFRSSKLHEKQAEAIAEIYERMSLVR